MQKFFYIFSIFSLLLCDCMQPEQDWDVDPVDHPTYYLAGQISDANGSAIPNATVKVTMTYLLQGEWVSEKVCLADSLGQYRVDSLSRGQYKVDILSKGELKFSKIIDLMKYDDRDFNPIIPGPPTTIFKGTVQRCSDSVLLSEAIIVLTPQRIENGGIAQEQIYHTNNLGKFAFDPLYPGLYYIVIMRAEYRRIQQDLYIPDRELYELVFCLDQRQDFSTANDTHYSRSFSFVFL